MSGNSVAHGDVSTSNLGELKLDGGYVYGETSDNTPPIVLDPIPASEINDAMANNDAPAGLTFAGSSSFNSSSKELTASGGGSVTFTSGTYYFSKVTFSGGSNIIIAPGADVKIYVTGDWSTSGGGMVNTDGQPANVEIYSTGNQFNFSGGSGFWACVYAPNAAISVSGSGDAYGSYIGREINNSGGTLFHYDEALNRTPGGTLSGYKVVSWNVL